MTPDVQNPTGTDRLVRRMGGALMAVLMLSCGCSESIREYSRFGGWSGSPNKPIVFSGRPERDSSAYGASDTVLSEHDWQMLEKLAPRPVWERIARLKEQFTGRAEPATRPATKEAPQVQPARDVPTVKLPDGREQMFYRLRHYGGVGVTSSRDGGTSRRKVTTTPPNLAGLVALVTAQLAGKGTVAPLPEENTLVITCDPAVKESVLTLLAGVDQPPMQVEISARVFEVNHDFDFQFGARTLINHIASDNKQGLAGAFSAQGFADAVVDPLVGKVPDPGAALRLINVFRKAGLTVDATFQALADTGLVKIVSSPRMTVTAGQTAYMLAGQELPIQSGRIANQQVVADTVTYKPVGVQLYITPQVVGPDSVKLHVITEVSAVAGFAELPELERQNVRHTVANPVFDSREAETYVTVANGSTLVLGGMRMIRTVTREQKVPGLGDVRFLEWLFKSHRSQNVVNDLYFFVTPRLIQSNGG